jgi:hypothetical protein
MDGLCKLHDPLCSTHSYWACKAVVITFTLSKMQGTKFNNKT